MRIDGSEEAMEWALQKSTRLAKDIHVECVESMCSGNLYCWLTCRNASCPFAVVKAF